MNPTDNFMKLPLIGMTLCWLFVIGTVFMVACEPTPQGTAPKFTIGQAVVVNQTGEQVLIVDRWSAYGVWRYECRVAGPIQQHRDGIMSRDTEITRYSLIVFNEFELRQ